MDGGAVKGACQANHEGQTSTIRYNVSTDVLALARLRTHKVLGTTSGAVIHQVLLDGEDDGAGLLVERRTVGAVGALAAQQARSVPRVDDRRVISGIVVALQSSGRWIDVPAE